MIKIRERLRLDKRLDKNCLCSEQCNNVCMQLQKSYIKKEPEIPSSNTPTVNLFKLMDFIMASFSSFTYIHDRNILVV